ncbi:ASKHA domain-containing protein [Thermovibrio ammonificans]
MKVEVSVPEGKSLYQVLREEGLIKSAYCGGRGICGKCRVRLGGKEELACLVFGPFEGEVEIEEELLTAPGENLPPIPPTGKSGFGVALDVGTTGVEAALFELSSGKFVKSVKGVNLQASFGADIVTRVELAREHYGKQRELLLKTVELLLKELPAKPTEVVAVCNSVIHHFLLGLPVSGFERYPFKLYEREPVETTGRELGLDGFPSTKFILPPPLESFVGSDLLANLHYLTAEGRTNFTVADLGTNAEIARWEKGEGVATSVPAGPAFEGVGLFSGMRAVEGAVYKVFFDGRSFRFLTIGNRKPEGICASGYFDLIYLLKSFRALNSEGTFTEEAPPLIRERIREINGEKAFLLYSDPEREVALTQSDIRKFMLAKAGVYGALKTLTEGTPPKELIFSGAFGSHLSERSVKGVKLIPSQLPPPEPAGNLALKGAALTLSTGVEPFKKLKEKLSHVELAGNKTFEKAYVEGLEL